VTASGRALNDKIKDLANKGEIPGRLADVELLRFLPNLRGVCRASFLLCEQDILDKVT